MKFKIKIITGISILLILCGCHNSQTTITSGEFWKKQALTDVIPYWTKYAQDTVYGAFHTYIDRKWNPVADTLRYPSMISRQVFGYSVAYLLSGDEKYLDIARRTKDFLLKNAWDKQYGGWFDILNREGKPVKTTKDMFIQVYAVTGLTMYYFVTHDKEVLNYIEKSDSLLREKAWDHTNGGYYNTLTQDWQVLDSRKTFAAQVAPVSGYLLYLYMATRDKKYLEQARQIMDIVTNRMIDTQHGWVVETCDKEWNYIPGTPDIVSIGHNQEVAWMLMRLCLLEENPSYLTKADQLGKNIRKWGFGEKEGIWYSNIDRMNPQNRIDISDWWIQAYGNMFSLIRHRITGEKGFIDDFEKGAGFWNSCFIDHTYGGTYVSVTHSGEVKDSAKGTPYKACYHSMEHSLLNYAYFNFWVTHQPVELHFSIRTDEKGDTLYPSPVEDRDIAVTHAMAKHNGKGDKLDAFGQAVVLPGSKDLNVTVTLQCLNGKH